MIYGNDKCTCKHCGKKFAYGDKNSPMLKNDVWNYIVTTLGLREYELQATRQFDEAYSGKRQVKDKEEYHLYLCTDCMEKTLGRKLTQEDLIGENVLINKEFEKHYFNNNTTGT